MTITETAMSQYGITEIPGIEHNEEILKYFSEIGHEWVKDDETSWCSAFINWCAKKSCLPYSGKLDARSWLNVGTEVQEPVVGDIVVLWREKKNSWKSHVGIFVRVAGNSIYILGGNQNNSVNVRTYPKDRLLGYRRL